MQQGGRGTQACITAHTQLQGIIGDLDTTLMFATTGALNAEADDDGFPKHRFVEPMRIPIIFIINFFSGVQGGDTEGGESFDGEREADGWQRH